MNLPKIVLTGGPGGGKTSFLQSLRTRDPNREQFILVPEAATLLIRSGHRPGTKEFQLAVVELQLALEKSCALPAKTGQVMVCDRSTVDSLAYWLLLGGTRKEFYDRTGLNEGTHLLEYHGVIHLQTAAIGAEAHYLQLSDGGRVESQEEAAKVDSMCNRVWNPHPNFQEVVNDPQKTWEEKCAYAFSLLERMIQSIPSDKEPAAS